MYIFSCGCWLFSLQTLSADFFSSSLLLITVVSVVSVLKSRNNNNNNNNSNVLLIFGGVLSIAVCIQQLLRLVSKLIYCGTNVHNNYVNYSGTLKVL